MIRFIILLLIGCVTGYSNDKDSVFVRTDDCVIFRNEIALAYGIEVGIKREPTGAIKVEAYRMEYKSDAAGKRQFSPRLLAAQSISEEDYRRIVALVESPEIKTVASIYPRPGLDGWTWKILRISHGHEISYSFFWPEYQQNVQDIERLLDLGRQVAKAAHLSVSDLSPALEEQKSPGTAARQ